MSADTEPLLLSDLQAAALAGVSRASWHRLRVAGKLPRAIKLGRCVRWSRTELIAWIGAGCPPADLFAEMQAQARRRGGA